MDIVGLAEELPADRILNLFESLILEEQMRNASVAEDERIRFKGHMQKLRNGGTISREELGLDEQDHNQTKGWTNDAPTRQPPPRYIEPTEDGYPGLEPPVG